MREKVAIALQKSELFSETIKENIGMGQSGAGDTQILDLFAVFGGIFSVKGFISIGVISAFIVYAKQFSRPINEIAQIYGQLQTAIAGAERVLLMMVKILL